MKSIEQIHKYWKAPDDGKNKPEDYLNGKERTAFLVGQIKDVAVTNDTILEIGCNCGRNLNGLWGAGFRKLSGIEISKSAVDVMEKNYTSMFKRINVSVGPAETELKKIKSKSVDIIFTMAVLEHIHEDSAVQVFLEMKRIFKKFLITVEDEKKISERHFQRNYKDVFEGIGLKEIKSFRCNKIQGLDKNYIFRIFNNG